MSKILAPEVFVAGLSQLRLPISPRPAMAAVVGGVELSIACAVILLTTWPSALFCSLAYAAFAAIVERARRSGSVGDCGCFGSFKSQIDGLAVLRNISFALVALFLAIERLTTSLIGYEMATGIATSVFLTLASAVVDTLIAVRGAATERP